MNSHTSLTALAACFGLAACGTFVTYTPININPWPDARCTKNPSCVEVYASSAPARPHVDVGTFDVDQNEQQNSSARGRMISALRAKAAEIGCDAVFLGATSGHEGTPRYIARHWVNLQATCLVYSDVDSCVTNSLCSRPPKP